MDVSVCAPSTCSFLICSATCSTVEKEWSHFGHVNPVSDTALLALHRIKSCYCFLRMLTTPNASSIRPPTIIKRNAYSL